MIAKSQRFFGSINLKELYEANDIEIASETVIGTIIKQIKNI